MIAQWYRLHGSVRLCNPKALLRRSFSAATRPKTTSHLFILGQKFPTDSYTNVTKHVISKLDYKLHLVRYHPLFHIRRRIVDYLNNRFRTRIGSPIFSVHDNISPIVSVAQNFDSLLVPQHHPSRKKTDCYYINQSTMLRAHMTAHQSDLISMGLNNFLVIGDVYRKDEIDNKHYPIFHQADAVRLCTAEELFQNANRTEELNIFEHEGLETSEKQACHTLESVKMMEYELKNTLTGLMQSLFGEDVKYRWVREYFPFTHPSWELEIYYDNEWIEILGCGIMRQEILVKSGAGDRIGWAFGMGLERLAMCLYDISNIRLFWSRDSGFLNQFVVDDSNTPIKYKSISIYPQCKNDISFWLPEDKSYSFNAFYDIVREVATDRVEQVLLIDEFTHPESNRVSHCYRIVYRHMKRTLSKREVNSLHTQIADLATSRLGVTLR